MITLKYWNSLSPKSRAEIAERFYGTQYFVDSIKDEYHHNFDFDSTGKMLKVLLSACYIKDSQIEVRCMIRPSFHVPKTKSGIIRNTLKNKPKKLSEISESQHRYYFRMYTESDPEDGENIWEEAYSESEARSKAYDDFHSITELMLLRVE